MFSGIVEHLGRIRTLIARSGGSRMGIDLGPLAQVAKLGDSISVAGCCLTIAELAGPLASFDVSGETLRKTTLGAWRAGIEVNCERALAVGDRIGGHFVSGHVDGVGTLAERIREANSERFVFALPEAVRAVEKGSIAIDGVSLTSWDCRAGRTAIALIPHTLERTTLGRLRVGDAVNVEQDMVGRWVAALMGS